MRYRVLAGLDYKVDGAPRRAEPGEVVDDLPEKSTGWLLRRRAIEEAPEPDPDDGGQGDEPEEAPKPEALPDPPVTRRKKTPKGGGS